MFDHRRSLTLAWVLAALLGCSPSASGRPPTDTPSPTEGESAESQGDEATQVESAPETGDTGEDSQGSPEETIDLPTAGFRITKPAGWTSIPTSWARDSATKMDYGSKAFNQMVKERADEPLLALVEDPDGVGASIKVQLRPVGKLSRQKPRAIAGIVTRQMAQTLDWFELEGEVEATEVSGRDAATFSFRVTVELEDGSQTEFLSRSWVVPRADSLFIIGASRPTGDAEAEKTVQAAIDSIEIAK